MLEIVLVGLKKNKHFKATFITISTHYVAFLLLLKSHHSFTHTDTQFPKLLRSIHQNVTFSLWTTAPLHRLLSLPRENDEGLFSSFWPGVGMSLEFNFHKRQTLTSHRAVNEQ